MTEIVPYTRQAVDRGFAADWLLDPAEIAQRIGGTEFVPQQLRNNPAAITACLLYGAEVGLGRMQSLAKIAMINGRPTLAAEAQRALILAAGHDIWIDENTITRCTIAGRRKDSDQISRVTWTMDDARRANLAGKQPWRMYPRQMLLARASAELARAVFPDAIGGLAATEELDDTIDTPTTPNGQLEQPPPKTTRRRRTGITAGQATTAPEKTDEPEPNPEPQPGTETPTAFVPPPSVPPAAPDDEQELIDDIATVFNATETTTEPQPEPEPAPKITELQRRKIHALFRERGITDRDQRLTYCELVTNHKLETSTDLTIDEASAVINHLEQYNPDDKNTHPGVDPFPDGF